MITQHIEHYNCSFGITQSWQWGAGDELLGVMPEVMGYAVLVRVTRETDGRLPQFMLRTFTSVRSFTAWPQPPEGGHIAYVGTVQEPQPPGMVTGVSLALWHVLEIWSP